MSANSPDLRGSTRETLREGCAALGLETDEQRVRLLTDYLALLARWNAAYNLTAVRDEAAMLRRHLLDSLAIAPHVRGSRLLDVGSGAGLPGVPLCIQFPDRDLHLLDSNGKKARFLFQVKTALRLANMSVHQARAETFVDDAGFDAVLSRAFASLPDMVRRCRHLLAPGGAYLAMKGALPESEMQALGELGDFSMEAIRLAVPGLQEERHLVVIRHGG